MTQTAAKYARVLWELKIPEQVIAETLHIYQQESELKKILENPVAYTEKKYRIVDRIFPEQIQGFLKLLCKYRDVQYLEEAVWAYREYANERNGILNAELCYVTLPSESQLKGIKKFLCEKYEAKDIELRMVQDSSLIGGFILIADGKEYDWSLRGRIADMKGNLSRR